MKEINLETVLAILMQGPLSLTDRKILEETTFYYCSGSDPTPIITFGNKYPLYIYVDIMQFSRFENAKARLYGELFMNGFRFIDSRLLHKKTMKNCEISSWKERDSEEDIVMVYIEGNASEVFGDIYKDQTNNTLIIPKCICNIKYEGDQHILLSIQEQSEYIFGHAYDERHKLISWHKYYGEYRSEGESISLFRAIV